MQWDGTMGPGWCGPCSAISSSVMGRYQSGRGLAQRASAAILLWPFSFQVFISSSNFLTTSHSL
jgi:hypothetical protein